MDINREVAEKVMGWEVLDVDCIPGERLMWASREVDSIGYKYFKPQIAVKDFDPLHKIQHSWMMVEKLNGDFHFQEHSTVDGRFMAMFLKYTNKWTKADTAPMAICLAALEAVKGA